MSVDRARLDRALAGLIHAVAPPDQASEGTAAGAPWVEWATIAAVNVGPPASLDINLRGTILPQIRYSAAIASPTVGDDVRIEIIRCAAFVTDKLA